RLDAQVYQMPFAAHFGRLQSMAQYQQAEAHLFLKSLELAGFKSFARPTKLEFPTGITAFVGPNGSGKSNIVDAIRWCLGEQSSKHLRGKAMDDVIFAGSDSRGGSGMCEVSLTFENDGRVPIEYLAYSEITVTRKLFRAGTR